MARAGGEGASTPPEERARGGSLRGPRVLVYGTFLAVVAVALADATLWPLSAWRLFSELRQPRSVAVSVVVERPDSEGLLDPGSLAREYGSLGHAVSHARRGGPDALDGLCESLHREVRRSTPDLQGLRIERTTRVREPGGQGAPRVLDREVLASCP